MIEFQCACGKPLRAEDRYAGQMTACPACGKEQPIPGGADAVRADPPRRKSENVRADRGWDPEPREVGERPPAPATSGKAVAALLLGLASVGCNVLTGLPAIILAILALGDIARSQGRLSGKGLAVAGIVCAALGILLLGPGLVVLILIPTYGYGRVQEAAARTQSNNNLKQMALAMHNYHDANGTLPPHAMLDRDGKPGLSWRVLILPYIEADDSYRQFKLDEPWDSPNNKPLLARMPQVYRMPRDTTAPPGYTYYQVFVSPPGTTPRAIFGTDPSLRTRFTDITDGLSNTLMIVEAANPVPWTKPDDLPFTPTGPLPALGGRFRGGFNAAFADGSVQLIPGTTPDATLRALITRDGGEFVTLP